MDVLKLGWERVKIHKKHARFHVHFYVCTFSDLVPNNNYYVLVTLVLTNWMLFRVVVARI